MSEFIARSMQARSAGSTDAAGSFEVVGAVAEAIVEEVGAFVQASVHAITARARALIDTDTTTL